MKLDKKFINFVFFYFIGNWNIKKKMFLNTNSSSVHVEMKTYVVIDSNWNKLVNLKHIFSILFLHTFQSAFSR